MFYACFVTHGITLFVYNIAGIFRQKEQENGSDWHSIGHFKGGDHRLWYCHISYLWHDPAKLEGAD
jgi:hypothetical protein